MIRAILAFLLWPVLKPLRWLNGLLRPRDALLEFQVEFDFHRCTVQIRAPQHPVSQELLIAAAVVAAAKYFWLCEPAQISAVSAVIADTAANPNSAFVQFTRMIGDAVTSTLSPLQLRAVRAIYGLSGGQLPVFWGELPPLSAKAPWDTESAQISLTDAPPWLRPKVYYWAFLVTPRSGTYDYYVDIPQGLDVVLLPLAFGSMLEVIFSRLEGEQNRQTLCALLLSLLDEYNTKSCKSLRALRDIPKALLSAKGIFPPEIAAARGGK